MANVHKPLFLLSRFRLLPSELLSISAEALRRYRLRTALSVLGIVFGIGAVIATISISEGARREALDEIGQLGLDNVIVRPRGVATAELQGRPLRGVAAADATIIGRLVPQTVAVALVMRRYWLVAGPVRSRMAVVVGSSGDHARITRLQTTRGRLLTGLDDQAAARVCVLGTNLAHSLFGLRDPIGRTVSLADDSYTVVGLLDDPHAGVGAGGPHGSQDLSDTALIPVSAMVGRQVSRDADLRVDEILLQTRDGGRVAEVGQIVKSTLLATHKGVPDFEVIVPRELLDQRYQVQRTFAVVIGTVAVVSLLIGSIGIMNVMLAAVLERTAEIGLRRTVGATRGDVAAQFLTEALLMTGSGGVVGVLAGILSASAISSYAGWPTHVSAQAVIAGLLASLLSGLSCGVYPAVRAARLEPIDAVRHE